MDDKVVRSSNLIVADFESEGILKEGTSNKAFRILQSRGIITNLNNLCPIDCRYCTKTFTPSHPAEKFCSEECRKLHRRNYRINYDNDNRSRINKLSLEWTHDNRERVCKNRRERIKRYRTEIFELLGNKCNDVNCPIPKEKMDIRCLHIDHVHGGGTKERKKYDAEVYYKKVLDRIKSGSTKYQLLCAYCNWLKRFNKGEI